MISKAPPPLAFSAGTTSVTGSGTVVFSNSNGITFGLSGSTLTASHNGLTAQSSLSFSNGSGVTFGTNGSTLTASVRTDYAGTGLTTATTTGTNVVGTNSTNGLSLGVPAFLTTAALSQDSSRYAGTGFTSATTTGTNVVGTNQTNGLSLGVPAYLTTAGLSQDSSKYAGTGFTSTTTNGTEVKATHDTNGLSLAVPAYITAAAGAQTGISGIAGSNTTYTSGTVLFTGVGGGVTVSTNTGQRIDISVGPYVTTARASTDAVGLNTAQTNVTWTVNSSGISLNAGGYAGTVTGATGASLTVNTAGVSVALPAYLTTAALSQDSSKYAGVNGAITGGSITVNTAGVSVNLPAYLTTADLSQNSSKYAQAWELAGNTAGTTSSLQGTKLYFEGGNSITVSGASNTVKFSVGNYLTTAMASNRGSDFVAAAAGFNGTNASGTLASNSWSVSVAAQSNQTGNLYAVGNTFGTSSGSHDARTLSLSAGAGLEVAASDSGFVVRPRFQSYYNNLPGCYGAASALLTATSGSSVYVQPFSLAWPVSASYCRIAVKLSDSAATTDGTTRANSTFTAERYTTLALVLYSLGVGASSRSLQSVTSSSEGITGRTVIGVGNTGSRYTVTLQKTYPVAGATSQYTTSYAVSSNAGFVISSESNTVFTGSKWVDVGFGVSLSAGNWFLGLGASTASATTGGNSVSFLSTAAMDMSVLALTQLQPQGGFLPLGPPAAGSQSDNALQRGLGVFTTNASLFSTASIALSQIGTIVTSSSPQMPFQLIREA